MSSLSQQMTVRSSMLAFSIGTSSSSRPSVMMKPPTCWLRWRGKPMISWIRSIVSLQPPVVGVEPDLAHPLVFEPAGREEPPELRGERADRVARQAHRGADLADGALAAIMDDRRAKARAVAAIGLVDVLDHLLAALMFEIDVDVGRLVARLGHEALEDHGADLGRDGGDAQRIADHGIGRRPAPLAEDAALAGKGDDVAHGEEVGFVFQLADEVELMGEHGLHLVGGAVGIAPSRARHGRGGTGAGGRFRPRRSRWDIRSAGCRGRRCSGRPAPRRGRRHSA